MQTFPSICGYPEGPGIQLVGTLGPNWFLYKYTYIYTYIYIQVHCALITYDSGAWTLRDNA